MADKKKLFLKVRTPAGIAAFSHIKEPDLKGKFADGKYKITLKIPKGTDISALEEAVRQVAIDEWGKVPADLASPFKDGDEMTDKDGKARILYMA